MQVLTPGSYFERYKTIPFKGKQIKGKQSSHSFLQFSGDSSTTDTLDFSSTAKAGMALYSKIRTFLKDNNDNVQSIEAYFALPFSALKMIRKAPKLLAFATGAEQESKDKKKKEAQYTRAKFEAIEQQGKETNALLLENFKEVKKTLDDVSKQLSTLRDAPLAAAKDQIISAQEAFEHAHMANSQQVRDEQMALFRHQLLFAFNHLSTAKQTGSTAQIRVAASILMSKGAFMLGQPNTAIHNADDALIEIGISDPKPEIYYQLGQEAQEHNNYKQAEFFFNIGILKATEMDFNQHQTEHLTSAKGYRLASEAYKQLGDYTTAEILARTAVAVDKQQLSPYAPRLIKTYTQLGEVLQAAGETLEATSYYEKALTLHRVHNTQDNPELLEKISTAYRSIGREGEANSIY